MSAGGSGKLFSSDGEWSAKSYRSEDKKPAVEEELLHSTSSIVSSGTLSDPDQERNYVRGFAQRAAEPDIKEIRAKGPHTYLKKAFQEGENFYEKERHSHQEYSSEQGRSPAKMSHRQSRPDSPISASGMDDFDGDENHDRYSRSSSARAGQSMMPEPSEYRASYPSMDDEDDYPPRQPRRSAPPRKQAAAQRVSYDTEKYSDAGSGEYNDVSNWGHEADSDHGMSMSSGISPRESRPRERKFDTYQATQALAWAGEKYTQAQIMRREGTAPEHYGVVEDMPTRMAYEQLNVLAGMAGKVQHVIEHNRKVFERRVMAADKAELSRAFQAWKAVRYGSVRKQQLLQRAVNKIARGSLARAFLAWKDKFAIVDKFLLMKRKGIAVNRMGRMRRAFKEWRVLVHERWWKDQMNTRDNDIDRLNRLCRKYENRPVTILGNRRLRSCISGWYEQAWERIRRRQLLAKAARRMAMRQLSSAWNTWFEEYDQKRKNKQHLQRTIGRLLNNKLSRAWGSWVTVVGTKERKRLRLARGLKFWENQSLSKGWNAWFDFHEEAKKYKRIFKHWKNGQLAKAYFRWVEFVDTVIRQRVAVGRAITKMLKKNLYMAFEAWVNAVDESNTLRTTSAKEALGEEVVRLRAENERLRRDNERFVRLIDSGEWGRGRVAELVQAGEVMKGERDALMKLIGSLRREYEAVQEAKAAQESELGDLKRRITNVGGAGRNRLLVKGGSSFNGLVRQMKQEMADAAAAGAPMDPNRLYEVNRLSMDQVQVFPDGELGVRGVDTVSARNGRFSIPIPVSGKKSPVKRMNVPAALQGMQSHGRSPGGSPLGRDGRHGMNALEDRIATAARRKPGVVATME